jgi:hypothetical protein
MPPGVVTPQPYNADMNAVTSNRRLVVIAILAGAILLALIIATGGGFQSPQSSPAPAGNPAPANNPPTTAPAPQAASGTIQGTVSVQTSHLSGHAWQFIYTVRDTGKDPIAGFQINGPIANLYDISRPSGWTVYGSGVCHGQNGGILVYWSVGPGNTNNINPGKSVRFGYKVNTTGTTRVVYSLSYQSDTPLFSSTTGPSASTLPASGSCK